MDVEKRSELIRAALRRTHKHFYVLPIHRQPLVWALRANVKPALMPGNQVRPDWIRID